MKHIVLFPSFLNFKRESIVRWLLLAAPILLLTSVGCVEDVDCPTRASTCPQECVAIKGSRINTDKECVEPSTIVGCSLTAGGDDITPLVLDTQSGNFYWFSSSNELFRKPPWRHVTPEEERRVGEIVELCAAE